MAAAPAVGACLLCSSVPGQRVLLAAFRLLRAGLAAQHAACMLSRVPRYLDVEEEETAMIAMFINDLRLARTGARAPCAN